MPYAFTVLAAGLEVEGVIKKLASDPRFADSRLVLVREEEWNAAFKPPDGVWIYMFLKVGLTGRLLRKEGQNFARLQQSITGGERVSIIFGGTPFQAWAMAHLAKNHQANTDVFCIDSRGEILQLAND